MNIEQFLKQNHVRYELLLHNPAYDAQHLAEAVHVSGENVAKTVLLRADGRYVLAVLQATHNIDLPKVQQALGINEVELATEVEAAERFPDCEMGAIPPFGSQYAMTTLVDASLAKDAEIVFKGNTNEEAFRVRYEDFAELEKPIVAEFSHHT
jgi:Ala-tRNA(Pro) deacylase